MKKQYLISLLGLAAIITPLGNCFFNDNQAQMWPMPNPDTVGKIIIEDSSEVTVFDTDKSTTSTTSSVSGVTTGKVSTGDQLESIKIDASYYSNYNKYQLPPKDEAAYYIYYGNVDDTTSIRKHLEVSYDELINIGGTYDKDYHTFSLDINSNDDYFTKYPNFWNYEIEDNDIEVKNDSITKTNEAGTNGFEITLNTTERFDDPNSKKHEISLGTVEIRTANDYSKAKTTVEIVDENGEIIDPTNNNVKNGATVTQTTASINYKITPKQNTKGNSKTEITKVEWIGLDNDTILDSTTNSELTGTLFATDLISDTLYKTKIVVTANEKGKKPTTSASYEVFPEISTSFTTSPVAPPTNKEFTNIYTDPINGVLEVKGVIDPNGSQVTKVTIIDISNIVSNTIVGEQTIKNSNKEKPINYDVYTLDYDGTLEHYALVIEYNDEKDNPLTTGPISLGEKGTYKDLSNLLDPDNLPGDDSSDGLGGWAIIGIIAGSIFLLWIIVKVGSDLLKKYKAKKE